MHDIMSLKEKLCRQLEEYAGKRQYSAQDLQIIDTISHTVKNLNKIIEKHEEEAGYSEAPRMRGSYSFRGDSNGYNYGNSRNMGDWRMNDYNMGGRYSMSNNEMTDRLRMLMNDAPDERTRMEFQKFINRMEQM